MSFDTVQNTKTSESKVLCCPSFIIVGAYKSGTTALYNYLAQHPEIYMTPVKETNFFALMEKTPHFAGPGDEHSPTTTLSLTNIEAYTEQFAGVKDENATGEASPLYLYDLAASENIARLRPDAKIIAILRQPAERAYSNFVQFLREGREPFGDFQRALDQESLRIAEQWEPIWHLKRAGLYYEQLKRYFDRFPRQQIKVFLQEDLRHHPQMVFREIFEFIGVDSTFRPSVRIKHNQSRIPIDCPLANSFRRTVVERLQESPRSPCKNLGETLAYLLTYKPQLSAEMKQALTEYYRADILNLQNLIERDLSHWLA